MKHQLRPLLLLLPILLLSACTNPPEGTYIGGAMKKKVNTKDGEEVMEFRPYTEQEKLMFHPGGELDWSKVQKGKPLHSKGTWKLHRDHAGHNNVHASFHVGGFDITYIMGQRKNDLGQEEMHLKAVVRDGVEKAVNKDSPLVMSAFVKAQDLN